MKDEEKLKRKLRKVVLMIFHFVELICLYQFIVRILFKLLFISFVVFMKSLPLIPYSVATLCSQTMFLYIIM